MTEEERCREAKRFQRIDEAFHAGDLDALRAAVDDPSVVPNGWLGPGFGTCLVYAIYHSPFAFIRTLLEAGADPNAPVDDGFPPIIAALMTGRDTPGAPTRTDVDEIIRLLLAFGADPNQRGINDYTALHTAVAEGNIRAVQMLLDAGADPEVRTRIDDYETPRELALRLARLDALAQGGPLGVAERAIGTTNAARMTDMAALLARRGAPLKRRLRSGLTLLFDAPGSGAPVRRQRNYRVRLRMWLHKGDPIRWQHPWGRVDVAALEDDGATLVSEIRINRGSLISGLFYGVEGMRIGGTRRIEIAPHLAYGESGVPGVIPPNAVLIAEITFLSEPASGVVPP